MRIILGKNWSSNENFEALDELNEQCIYEKEQEIIKLFAKYTNTEDKIEKFFNNNNNNYMILEKIFLEKLETNDICTIGQKIHNHYKDDLNFVRTVLCENSYIEIKTDKGYDILSNLKNDFGF